ALSQFLSTMMVILLAMFAVKIIHHHLRIALSGQKVALPHEIAATIDQRDRPAPRNSQSETTPDVYYIILDGYARADTLKRECQFDNSEFLEQLRSRGFYVADQSCSNYPMTFMSLASSLNMSYLDNAMTQASGFGLVWPFWDRGAVAHLF